MSGKLCVGQPVNNVGAGRISQSRALCEGADYRLQGTALAFPDSDNPHPVGSPDYEAWNNGWTKVNINAGTTIPVDELKCCAIDRAQVVTA